jgi:gamma-glutamyltranspeptidase / glutathione hydrolase
MSFCRCRIVLTILVILLVSVVFHAGAASPKPLLGTDGMVVSESPEASLVGAQVLAAGGNAIDAAIAVHFALAVTYPQAGNLGGGGFMLIRLADGTAEAIDFREMAPAAAMRDLFIGADGRPDRRLSTGSLLASGVPGAVAGMGAAHERHGTKPWRELIEPAQTLAGKGVVLDEYSAGYIARLQGRLSTHPESRRIYLNNGKFHTEGDTFYQPELAKTLGRIALQGPSEFYTGETAKLLITEMERGGGIMTSEDLRGYRPRIRQPIEGHYRGTTILTMPPPSSGGIALAQMFAYLEPFELRSMGALSSRATHILAEAMKRAFADRAEFLGDADFTPVPVQGLLAQSYLDSLAASISLDHATPALSAGPGVPAGAYEFYQETGGQPGADINLPKPENGGVESRQTTHFSIVDKEGNAVSCTTTLNTSFGNGHMVTGAGFLLNNEMDDFASAPGEPNYYGLIQGEANAVRPFARPLSSMTPTIVTRDGNVEFVLGSPGGPKIITSVFQTLVNVLDHGMNIQAAIDCPRVHHQWWPDTLRVEPSALTRDVMERLQEKGHALGGSWYMGSVQGIQVVGSGEGRRLYGGSDPRRNGCAVAVKSGRIISRCAPR